MMRNPLDVPIMRNVIGFQDSYDALLPSTSSDPHHLISFQANPERQEQQKKPEQAERQAAKAPIDLRDVLNRKEQNKIEQLVQKKRARELAHSDAVNSSPNPSPVQQPEARRVRFSDELLSQSEARQYDIAARDAVRLQRELKSGNPDSGLDVQKFETTTSKGNPEDVRNLDKASIGMHFLRPVKKPTLLLDRIPPWFERLREDLHRGKSSLVKPLPSKVKLAAQRYGRHDLANQLPEVCPAGSTSTRQAAGHDEISAAGSTTSVVSTTSQSSTAPATTATRTDVSAHDTEPANQTTVSTTIAPPNDQTMPLEALEDIPASLSRTQAADIELELNELPGLSQQDLPSSEVLAASLNEVLQDEDAAMDNAGHE